MLLNDQFFIACTFFMKNIPNSIIVLIILGYFKDIGQPQRFKVSEQAHRFWTSKQSTMGNTITNNPYGQIKQTIDIITTPILSKNKINYAYWNKTVV
jgi:hypothetical protein